MLTTKLMLRVWTKVSKLKFLHKILTDWKKKPLCPFPDTTWTAFNPIRLGLQNPKYYFILFHVKMRLDTSASILTTYRMGNHVWIHSRIKFYTTNSLLLSVSNSFRLLLPQVHEAKWSPPPSAKHKNPWNYTSILPHILTR